MSDITKSYDVSYSSYSGVDIIASITIPQFNIRPLVIGELQTVSYSIHKEVVPVRVLGRANPKGFTSGTRTIAGSLIFTVFDTNLVHKIVKLIKESYNGAASSEDESIKAFMSRYDDRMKDIDSYAVMDEMPPFDITISFANEYGNYSTLVIKGIVIVDEGQVMSVEDMITENTMSYMAKDIQVLKSQGQLTSTKVEAPVVKPSDLSLKKLSVSTGEMTTKFDPSNYNYTVFLPVGTVVSPAITAVARSSTSIVTVSGTENFPGRVRIRVQGSDGRENNYYIQYKLILKDATLSSLTINNQAVEGFSPSTLSYNIAVRGIDAIPKIVGIPNDILGAIAKVNRAFVVPGITRVVVTADDNKTQKTYSVNLSLLPQNTNTNLTYIIPSTGVLETIFDPDVLLYKIIVPYGTTALPMINARTEDEDAIMAITQPKAFSSMEYAAQVVVTAEKRTVQKTYTCTVEKDYKPFTMAFNGAVFNNSITVQCRIGEMYETDGDAIGFDSYMDVNYEGHSVYLEKVEEVVLSVANLATVSGTYKGYIETSNGMMHHILVTSVSYA